MIRNEGRPRKMRPGLKGLPVLIAALFLAVMPAIASAKPVPNPKLTLCISPTIKSNTYYVSAYRTSCLAAMRVFKDFRRHESSTVLLVDGTPWRYLVDRESTGDDGDDYVYGSGLSRVSINDVPTSGILS